MIILDEKTKQALLDYKKGQLKFEHLAHLCATRAKKVPVVDIDNPSQLTQKDFIYIDNAATAPLLLPVKLFAENLELNYRSNYGRSYGYNERIISRCLSEARNLALEYFGACKDDIAVFGNNISNLVLLFYQHVIA